MKYLKTLVFILKPHLFLGFLRRLLLLLYNTLNLSEWMGTQGIRYTFRRDYSLRYDLYQKVLDGIEGPFMYLEFGVFKGESMKWWAENSHGVLFGFDTFEGIPENWGKFKKGSMASGFPDILGVVFIKGLFQKSLPIFARNYELRGMKVIHMDADLFSSTLFVLAALHPYLGSGDILIFDEFNCPNDEFAAYKIFTDCFDIKMELIYEVNNYHQVAFKIIQ